jgi:hypothetical protein
MDVKEADRKIVDVAQAVLTSELHPIQGCRNIARLYLDSSFPEHEAFVFMRGIDSQTDHFPLGEVRKLCAPDYLKQRDAEIESFLADERENILASCREIVKAFSQ